MADRQPDGGVAGGVERGDGRLHRRGGAADDGLAGAVDVGDDDVAVDAGDDPLDLGEGREHCSHGAVVLDVEVGHLAAPGTHRLEGVSERQGAGSHESAVLAEAVAHDEVGARCRARRGGG